MRGVPGISGRRVERIPQKASFWGAGREHGNYHLSGGTLNVGDYGLIVGHEGDGEFTQTGGELFAPWVNVAYAGGSTGVFTQVGGTVTVFLAAPYGGSLGLGAAPGDDGTYELGAGGQLTVGDLVVGWEGAGAFLQTGGLHVVTGEQGGDVQIAAQGGSSGEYRLSGGRFAVAATVWVGQDGTGSFVMEGGEFAATGLCLGCSAGGGTGTFNQSGGIVTVCDPAWYGGSVCLGGSQSDTGRYDLGSGAQLTVGDLVVAWEGTGIFVQTGGSHTVTGEQGGDVQIGAQAGSNGEYRLSGGTFAVAAPVWVGQGGAGSFVMNGGTVEGTTDEARMIVNGSTGTLIGVGTFDITVTYESPKVYGTNGNQSVDATFPPLGLTVGGPYSVQQLTPQEFAGGIIAPALLESGVFAVEFGGSWESPFELSVPYDQAEVDARGGNEFGLRVLRETGPASYDEVPIIEIDAEQDRIIVRSSEFGRFAVALLPGDFNGDGDDDDEDMALQAMYMFGPDVLVEFGDLSSDGDCDLGGDYAVLQQFCGWTLFP